jgi:deoxyribodipyrimidine photo-lyase
MKKGLVIFRRDLRIDDNTALNAAIHTCDTVYPCFIFNPSQTTPHAFFSINGLCFLIEAIEDLSAQIAKAGGVLSVLRGDPTEVIGRCIKKLGITDLFVNKDYTPFSRERDRTISELCHNLGVEFHSFSDALLVEPSKFGKPGGGAYTVYTPFAKRASLEEIKRPVTLSHKNISSELIFDNAQFNPRELWPVGEAQKRRSHGSRAEALGILEKMTAFAKYKEERDFPNLDATTILSPHNKFGTVSIREVYWKVADHFGVGHTLIRELFWRDFFTHIAWHFPHVFRGSFHQRLDRLKWQYDDTLFEKWCKGETGFPIIDAGMRELVSTGYMHNRVRMIVASFLTKDLLIDWRKGEAFFAKHLTEYDPAVNNGSWQWAASTGCDAQPYFRIFNPWLQQEKFDSNCDYIKRWVPELRDLPAKSIHKIAEGDAVRPNGYPAPCVDHATQKILATGLFKEL